MPPLFHLAQAAHELAYKAVITAPLALVGVFWPAPRDDTPEA